MDNFELNMTPREREVERRLKQLEGVVSTMAKSLYTDDSMTTMVTNTTNNDESPLVKANADLRAEIEARDREIQRLRDVIVFQDKRIDDYHDAFMAIRGGVEKVGDGW